jgi:hypothetical protein
MGAMTEALHTDDISSSHRLHGAPTAWSHGKEPRSLVLPKGAHVKLSATCLFCGNDVDLASQLQLPADAPFGCPYCDHDVAVALGKPFLRAGDAAA